MATPRQMTAHPSINHPPYFLESAFTGGGRYLLFTSYRTGAPQLFLLDVAGGSECDGNRPKQLTYDSPIHPYSAAIRGERIFFVRNSVSVRNSAFGPGSEICEYRLDQSSERTIASFPGIQLGEVSPDPEGLWLVAAAKSSNGCGMVCGRADGSGWHFISFERTVIHPQFCPVEPQWIEFAGDPAPRMHRVRRHGTGLECLYQHGNDEFVVHETFLGRTGDIVFTVWPYSLRRMDWSTREISAIVNFNAWHISPNRAGTAILCDTNHPDTGIWSIDVATGDRRHVCLTESSNQGSQWKKSSYALAEDFVAAQKNQLSWMETAADTVYGPQWTHPHPSLSPDEKWISFTSDRTGFPQVYIVAL